jgi:2-iminoacetate synthase
LTIYQETYDEDVYASVHASGPKRDYFFRIDAPERAGRAGFRCVNIGALLGLRGWRRDVFFMGMHAAYLQRVCPDVEIGASVPRLRPHAGCYPIPAPVRPAEMAQIITALRIFLPRVGLTLSTREGARLREGLIPLGITRLSAGSSTKVGGHSSGDEAAGYTGQFEISDERGVDEISAMLMQHGYQPVLKDWMHI